MTTGLPFDISLPPGGYAWWYFDAATEDGTHVLTVIAFAGDVFSPYYARDIREGRGDPDDFCAINVALSAPGRRAWVMTEWPRGRVQRRADRFTIGTSEVRREADRLEIELDERTSPFPWPRRAPLCGRIVIELLAPSGDPHALDAAGRHRWYPLGPLARARVELSRPEIRFEAAAYHDANSGTEPLIAAFRRWRWYRTTTGDATTVFYEGERRDGSSFEIARVYARSGQRPLAPPPLWPLRPSRWALHRAMRAAGTVRIVRDLEDTPFYARSLVRCGPGDGVLAIHEHLELERLRARWVQTLLPFRMRRIVSRR